MSHPEKYTEAFMATRVIKPLLEVLVYLHSMSVIHRCGVGGHAVIPRPKPAPDGDVRDLSDPLPALRGLLGMVGGQDRTGFAH